MKTSTTILGATAALMLLALASSGNASVSVSVGVGIGTGFHHEPNVWDHRYHPAVAVKGCVPSSVVVVSRPVYVSEPVVYTSAQQNPPYGYALPGGVVKSPYSDFQISSGGRSPGDVVFDANNGRAFRIP